MQTICFSFKANSMFYLGLILIMFLFFLRNGLNRNNAYTGKLYMDVFLLLNAERTIQQIKSVECGFPHHVIITFYKFSLVCFFLPFSQACHHFLKYCVCVCVNIIYSDNIEYFIQCKIGTLVHIGDKTCEFQCRKMLFFL